MEVQATYHGTYQRKSLLIELHRSFMRFVLEEDPLTRWDLPYSELVFENVGKNNLIIKISHRYNQEWQFFCSNKLLARDLKALGFGPKLKLVEAKIRSKYLYFFSIALIPLFFLGAFPLILRQLGPSVVDQMIGEKKLDWLGNYYLEGMVGSNRYQDHDPQDKAVTLLLTELVKNNPELQGLKINLVVSKSSEPNAFALPGEIIVVNEGLIKKAREIEEIYGVMAHELAHLKERHITKNLLQSAGMLSGVVLLKILVGDFSFFGESFVTLQNLSFSRDLEREADRVGFEILVNSHISPLGLSSFFKQMKEEDHSTPGVLSYLSTHPGFEERVAEIESMHLKLRDNKWLKREPSELRELKALFP